MIKPQFSVLLLLISQSADITFVLIRVVKWGNGAKLGKYRWYENGSNRLKHTIRRWLFS
ncbi:hypothetical protein HanXRQr2_Chr15g0681011 [Helianthus annuus]|uniref:Uncharacterized protein n=1 Tax=Helianthus annuus TaxID=4232 RepID=A0A9K3E066_HELAN|nr:hypothetical protein HanXRQr2_Chr15g0681011 [Helianthus annuus]